MYVSPVVGAFPHNISEPTGATDENSTCRSGHILSNTIVPFLMTTRAFRKALMFFVGSPSTRIRSASFPGAIFFESIGPKMLGGVFGKSCPEIACGEFPPLPSALLRR